MHTLTCHECGGELRRSKRKFLERFRYLEAYRCSGCGVRYHVSISSRVRSARFVQCPRCFCFDVTALKRRDTVDKMRGGLFNLIHKIFGGKLYHCWFCRLQFYDFRRRKNLSSDWVANENPETITGT